MPWPSDTDPDVELVGAHRRASWSGRTPRIQLIASENFTSPAVLRAIGLGAHQQVLRGLPGQALLRRQRSHRRGRGPGHRPGARQLFGAEHANVQPHSGANANMAVYLALLAAGRHRAGPQPRPRRPPHPRLAGQRQRHALQLRAPTSCRPSDERIDMDQVRDLALEHRPKMIVAGATAYPRRIDPEPFRAIADEVGALLHVRRRPHRRAHRRRRAPEPGAVSPTSSPSPPTRRCAARAAAASCPRPSTATAIDKAVFPGLQGGPLEHVIAGKAVAFREAMHPSFRDYAAPDRRQRRGAGRGLGRRGLPPRVGRHRQPPDAGRPARRSTPSSPARRPRPCSTRPASR